MIKLNKLNKYFYKGESREIHVINDCTIDLPDTGLITFLGTSGSGKTTLLNVIGGLDKSDNGSITYGDNTFTNKDLKKIDEYRKDNIGYIFQNYLLFNEKTVYNNLKEALEIVGVYDAEEQRKRIEYALEKVNMFKFRRKKVKNLSGGQMQRVSIARALVKDAKIIIADEPTGNIDSSNTIEVMNILKKLSETTLIILVTHEESIANYYSDRIINIKDGKIISDEIVTERKKLNNETDQKIYLLDYKNEVNNSEKLNVDLYYDDKATESNVQIIIKNNTIYIKSDKKVINLNESSIKVVNENYHDIEVDEKITNDETFDTSWYKTEKAKHNKLALFFKNIGEGFVNYFSGKKSFIGFMIIFILLGAITASSCINLIKFINYDDSYLFDEEGYYYILSEDYANDDLYSTTPYLSVDDRNELIKLYNENIINEYLYVNIRDAYFSIKQSIANSYEKYVSTYYYPYKETNLIIGNAPKNGECVIGKKLADNILESLNLSSDNYKYLIGKVIDNLKIVGVSKDDTIMTYVNSYDCVNYGFPIISNISKPDYNEEPVYIMSELVGSYEVNKDNIKEIESGKIPEVETEIIISAKFKELFVLGDTITYMDADNKEMVAYSIVGFYKNKNNNGFDILSIDERIIGNYVNYNNSFAKNEYYDYYMINDSEYVLLSGSKPSKSYEVLANVNSSLKIGDQTNGFTVTGIYDVIDEYKQISSYSEYANIIITHGVLYAYEYEINNLAFKISNDKVNEVKEYLKQDGYRLMSINQYQSDTIKKETQQSKLINIILTLFLIVLVVLFTYLTSRSKMIHEIYSIGVYRSLGKSIKDIKKKAIYISVAQTTTSSLAGYVLIIAIYLYFGYNYMDLFENFSTKPALLLLGVPVMYFINIVFSLIPYNSLLRKTPAQIISKFDI